jgi:hypothetical protein
MAQQRSGSPDGGWVRDVLPAATSTSPESSRNGPPARSILLCTPGCARIFLEGQYGG